MQTEVSTLPVVHFNAHKSLNRKQNSDLGRPSVEIKTNSPLKNIPCLSSKKKTLHPLPGQPYQSNARQCFTSEQSKFNKNPLEQRVRSAKMLRIKELQNQLADAHYRLNELANENKLLKALQKRQDSALKRYEGTNAELPRIINSHHEELRVLQVKYKKLKALQKETCDLLKEKENELQHLQSQNKHLLQLSKDRNLGEREKLQLQVSDLNHRIEQQQDTIQTLHRKLTLETKSLKQQLQIEISKRKEAQKHLLETTEKLRVLENFLDNRERRLYYNGQLLFPDKRQRFGTQSLTNLRDISSSNPLKLSEKKKKWHVDVVENDSPVLRNTEINSGDIKVDGRINSNQTVVAVKTETMTNLDQVRKYRLQKSPYIKNVVLDAEVKLKELTSMMDKASEISVDLENSEQLETQPGEGQKYYISGNKLRRIYKNRTHEHFNELLENELDYSSEDSNSENENSKDNYTNPANNSKLRARSTGSTNETSDSKELTFSDCKHTDNFEVLVRERKHCYESDIEIKSGMIKESIKKYATTNRCDSDREDEKSTTLLENILDDSQKCCQNLINETVKTDVQTKNIEPENMYAQFDVRNIQVEYTNSEDSAKYTLQQAVSKEQEHNRISRIEDDAENSLPLDSYLREEDNTPFRTSDNVESPDTKSEITRANEMLFNNSGRDSMKYFVRSSKDLDEKVREEVDTIEMGIINKGTFFGNSDLETRNELNRQELENIQSENDSICDTFTDISATNENNDVKTRITKYAKERLLASMKAIDDNEQIEFSKQDYEKRKITNRKQMADNIFLDLPSHIKKKQDIIKDIFDTGATKNESTGS